MLKKSLLILFISTALVSCMRAGGLEETKEEIKSSYPFLRLQADTIVHAERLADFFDKLNAREKGENTVLNIVHIGDSHLQADFITQEVRSLFQQNFGNAGRGLVFPLRLAHTNEPPSIRSSSASEWLYTSVISKNKLTEPGIAAATLQTVDSLARFEIALNSSNSLNYDFTKATFICPNDSACFDFYVSDTAGNNAQFVRTGKSTEALSVRFSRPTNQFALTTAKTDSTQTGFSLNGIVLENDQAGVRYHSIGINGARYKNYNASPLFFRQLPILQPDLIIISLGTNEASARDITADEVYFQATSMIRAIRSTLKNVPVLVVVPAHDYYRKKYYNPYLKLVRAGLLNAAESANAAVLDMYEIGGGYGSCQKWKANGLLRPDGVHFTVKGYQLQGKLLYNALIDSYQTYGKH